MTTHLAAEPTMYVPRMATLLNRWFTRYEDARAALDSDGGFLFPYGTQFFVTVRAAIGDLGLDPDDSDWARIGWDWVRPADPDARERLRFRRALAV